MAGRVLAVVPARDEAPAIRGVLDCMPDLVCGLPVDVVVVDDGSRDRTADIAREAGALVLRHTESRGVGAALRTGLEHARRHAGYAAVAHIDGDGEYDPNDLERVLAPILRGEAEYVLGSRFLGRREGMAWHRSLTNRAASALVGALIGSVVTDAQTGHRALGARALEAAEIRHDYNSAQVLTLALWGMGIHPVEVPISYRRRTTGRSFVRYPEYLRRVTPAVWRAWRAAARARRTRAAPESAA